jgi:hypothetical protein
MITLNYHIECFPKLKHVELQYYDMFYGNGFGNSLYNDKRKLRFKLNPSITELDEDAVLDVCLYDCMAQRLTPIQTNPDCPRSNYGYEKYLPLVLSVKPPPFNVVIDVDFQDYDLAAGRPDLYMMWIHLVSCKGPIDEL